MNLKYVLRLIFSRKLCYVSPIQVNCEIRFRTYDVFRSCNFGPGHKQVNMLLQKHDQHGVREIKMGDRLQNCFAIFH